MSIYVYFNLITIYLHHIYPFIAGYSLITCALFATYLPYYCVLFAGHLPTICLTNALKLPFIYRVCKIPVCCVQWIKFQPHVIKRNCAIGTINMCDWLSWDAHPKMSSFIAFNDLQPTRYAMSYIEESNHNAYTVQVAFIALDSENLGELVNDGFHTDFGDNKFPYYKGNTNVQIVESSSDKYKSSNDSDDDYNHEDVNIDPAVLSDVEVARLNKYIPQSMLHFLSRKL